MRKRFLIPLVLLMIIPAQMVSHRVLAQTFVGGTGALTVTPLSISSATGQQIQVSVTGLAPNQLYQVCIKELNQCIQQSTGSTGGMYVGTLYVPAGTTPGLYTVTATPTGCCGFPTAQSTFTVTPPPAPTLGTLTAQYAAVQPGSNTSVYGSGWTPGLEVSVCLQTVYGSNPLSCNHSVTVQANGSFGYNGVSLYVPQGTPSGSYTVIAYYNNFQQLGNASTQLSVQASSPVCAIPRAAIAAGASVTVTCSNLQPGTASIQFQSGGTIAGQGSAAVNQNGSATISVAVNGTATAGTYNVVIVNNGLAVTPTPQPTVQITATPTLDTTNVADPLTTLTFTGTNYGACNVVTIAGTATLNGGGTQTVQVQTQADNNGDIGTGLTCSGAQQSLPQVTIPGSAVGGISFTASALVGGQQVTSTPEVVTIIAGNPQINLNELQVTSGSTVGVTVTGFLPGNGASTNPIVITPTYTLTNGTQSNLGQQTIYPNANGTATAQLAVPVNATGAVVITAYQAASNVNVSNNALSATTPTPTPTATATIVPTRTPTPTPTSTPTPVPSPTLPPAPTANPVSKMKIKAIRVQWSTVQAGSYNILSVQANQGGNIQVSVTVSFPGGAKASYSGTTNGSTKYTLQFPVPANAGKGQALVTVRLQKGSRGVTGYAHFTVV